MTIMMMGDDDAAVNFKTAQGDSDSCTTVCLIMIVCRYGNWEGR